MHETSAPSRTRLSRRNLLALGAAASAAPVLAACGSDDSGGGGGNVTLGLWTWASEFEDAFATAADEYHQLHPNVTVKPRYWSFANYAPSLQAALAAKEEGDIFMPLVSTLALAQAERTIDLRKALGADFLDGFFPSTNEENVYQDGQYAVGWAAQTFGLFHNTTLMAQLGLTPPETWDDLAAMAPKINAAGLVPMSIQGNPSNQLSDFMLPIITQITDDPQVVLDLDTHEKKGVSWDSEPVVQALTIVKQLTDAGVFSSGVLATDSDTANSTFTSGKAAMLFTGSFFPPSLQTTAPPEFLTQYGIAKTPTVKPGGKHWCANQAGYTWAVSSGSKNQDAAVDFLKYLYDPARYLKMMNDTFSMPSTEAAADGVSSSDIKTMTSWLLDGEGAPHIMFGKGTLDSVTNGVVSVVNGSATPAQAAKAIEAAVVQARKI
ncbi:ABC transporter substrate-binding protein [Kineococcus rhizosphaerae]|uniref:ABC-type glycerol-3-phosphate transport system substrate-binding protein n=1 Tax=Kineococcus rhizosphaerae TaxID=559628 RepID=A0A2T0R7K3_9ACTN|nr:extracellular solute-binding protein [Kineococcus rhizosphaerae]PRY17149.1 ABC-type glycerol-3-phosphate transport system substrate-binding protein [Kineococcus rhizosphaerae]